MAIGPWAFAVPSFLQAPMHRGCNNCQLIWKIHEHYQNLIWLCNKIIFVWVAGYSWPQRCTFWVPPTRQMKGIFSHPFTQVHGVCSWDWTLIFCLYKKKYTNVYAYIYIYMCIYVYINMNVYMYICILYIYVYIIYIYMYVYVCMHAWMCMDVHGCALMCMDVHGCAWMCMDVHGCAWMCVYVCMYVCMYEWSETLPFKIRQCSPQKKRWFFNSFLWKPWPMK